VEVRADRLVALLLLLQQRGRVTVAEVARELETSERTARRDLEALGLAGLPVYSRAGRHGGWQLLGGARTDLSGLSASEARALFLVAGPASSATPEVRAALRKLVRALPEPFREQAEAAGAAIVADPTSWYGSRDAPRAAPRWLDEVQHAVVDGEQLRLAYVARDGSRSERVVHPLGLATRSSRWYLVAGTDAGLRTFRVDRIDGVERTGQRAHRPDGFDLAAAWQLVTAGIDERHRAARAEGSAEPGRIGLLRAVLGDRLRIGPPRADGRIAVEVMGPADAALAGELAGMSNLVHVEGPPEVVRRLAAIGAELVARHAAAAAADATRAPACGTP
jgi:predicted DNA-binding transcriptional regulator YafY